MADGWLELELFFIVIGCLLLGLVILFLYLDKKVTRLYKHIDDHRKKMAALDNQSLRKETTTAVEIDYTYHNDRVIKDLEECVKSTTRGSYTLPIAAVTGIGIVSYALISKSMSTNSPVIYAIAIPYFLFLGVIYYGVYVGLSVSKHIVAAHNYTLKKLRGGKRFHFSIDENDARVPYALTSIYSNPAPNNLDYDLIIPLRETKLALLFVEVPDLKKSLIFLYHEPGKKGRRQIMVADKYFDDPLETAADFLLSKNVPVQVAWSGWPSELINFWSSIVDNEKHKWIADHYPHKMNKVYTNEDFYPTSTDGKRDRGK